MRRFSLLLTGLAFSAFSLTALAEGNYRTYVNSRYGYSISYPSNLIPQPESDSGDGRAFLSKNGDAELLVFASACYQSADEYLAEYKKKHQSGELSLTYSRKGKGFVVVSGIKKGRIFYDKMLISGEGEVIETWCTSFHFEHDETALDKYKEATKRLSSSLKAPPI